jgi:hypothetical protein
MNANTMSDFVVSAGASTLSALGTGAESGLQALNEVRA